MRIKPTANNVVLERRDGSDNGKANKIILPSSVEDDRKGWFVIDIGPEVTRCKKGDQIAFSSEHTGGQLELQNGKKYVVMPEKDIVGIIIDD